nr:SH3 domain-containing protein [Devosia oryziradicis]
MALSKKLMAGGIAALALLATTASAFAAQAYATGNVNVRSGPGTGYSRVDTLRAGQQVDVIECRGSWCYIEKRGPDGWVSANYLSRSGGWQDDDDWGWDRPPHWNPRPPRPPHWNPRPWPQPQPWPTRPGNNGSVCFNGPNGYFCIGN